MYAQIIIPWTARRMENEYIGKSLHPKWQWEGDGCASASSAIDSWRSSRSPH